MLIIHVGLSQFVITNVATIFIPLWGMIGIWTTKIGCVTIAVHGLTFEFDDGFVDSITPGNSGESMWVFFLTWIDAHDHARLRAYNVVFGLFQAPYYAFSQTMMAGQLIHLCYTMRKY